MTNVNTTLNYLAESVKSSLYRNKKVFTRRDRDGNDGAYHGATMNQKSVTINDARNLNQNKRKKLDIHGFELLNQSLELNDQQFFDHSMVIQNYYPKCIEAVKQATNASCVFAFDYNVRWPAGKSNNKRIEGGQQVQAPLHYVHGDYTLISAPQRLRSLIKYPGTTNPLRFYVNDNKTYLNTETLSDILAISKRYCFINVWRNIDYVPVMKDPLALCDARSKAPDDLVVFEIFYEDRIGENYFAKYSPKHSWWYYSFMTRDEVILIKQWDSAGRFAQFGGTLTDSNDHNSPCTFSFHTAFTDPNTVSDAPDRKSIEVRCVALFD